MKHFIISLSLLLAAAFALNAENVTREEKFAALTGISAGDAFNITLVDGTAAMVNMTLEDVLADYVHLTLVDGVLDISYDEKSITKEVRAALRSRDQKSIRMDVTVTVPPSAGFNSIKLSQNAVFTSTAALGKVEDFHVTLSGNSVIKALSINADRAEVNMSRRADAKLSTNCGSAAVKCEGNSVLELNAGGSTLSMESLGASTVKVNSSLSSIKANICESSKLSLYGTLDSLIFSGRGSSQTDAGGLVAKTATIGMYGSNLTVNATDRISLDLSGGAKLQFIGSPAINIVRVEKSSINRKEEGE